MSKNKAKFTTTVSLDLPTELVERVREYSARDFRTIKAVVVMALNSWLATHEPTSPETTVGTGEPTRLTRSEATRAASPKPAAKGR